MESEATWILAWTARYSATTWMVLQMELWFFIGFTFFAVVMLSAFVGFYVFHVNFHRNWESTMGLPPPPLDRHFAPPTQEEKICRQQRFVSGHFDNRNYWMSSWTLSVLLTDRRLIVRFPSSWPGLCLAEIPLENILLIRRDARWKKLFGPSKPIVITYTESHARHSFAFQPYQQKEWLDEFIALKVSTDRT